MLRQVMVFCTFLCVVSFTPVMILAQDASVIAEAREHFSRGEMAFNQGRWLDCATHFESSFQAIFAPELLYNIGLCYERAADTMGDVDSIPYMERALSAYTRYLRELPTSSDVPAIRIRIADLRLLLDRARAVAAEDEEVVEEDVTPAPVLVIEDVPLERETEDLPPLGPPVEDRGFGFGWTLTAGAFTVASLVTAIGLSVAAQEQFNSLAATCGQTMAGCLDSEISEIETLALGANAMYVVSGILAAATGVAIGLEFHFWSTPTETHASLGYSTSF